MRRRRWEVWKVVGGRLGMKLWEGTGLTVETESVLQLSRNPGG